MRAWKTRRSAHLGDARYRAVCAELLAGQRVLDVGIGTGTALAASAAVVEHKGLTVVGLDYEADYVAAARRLVDTTAALRGRVTLVCGSVYDAADLFRDAPPFDAVYFSGSLTLMPDPPAALRAVAPLLRPGGRVYVTQTYQRRALPGLATLKPLLKYATTIDFGQLTTEAAALDYFAKSGLHLQRHEVIPGSVDTPLQAAFLSVLAPR